MLPSYLSVGAKSKQGDYDVSAVVGIGVAAATNSAIAQNSEVDVRQAYLTFGNKDMGTVKLGRDYGTFGFLPIISDMTLLGVGAATRAPRMAACHWATSALATPTLATTARSFIRPLAWAVLALMWVYSTRSTLAR